MGGADIVSLEWDNNGKLFATDRYAIATETPIVDDCAHWVLKNYEKKGRLGIFPLFSQKTNSWLNWCVLWTRRTLKTAPLFLVPLVWLSLTEIPKQWATIRQTEWRRPFRSSPTTQSSPTSKVRRKFRIFRVKYRKKNLMLFRRRNSVKHQNELVYSCWSNNLYVLKVTSKKIKKLSFGSIENLFFLVINFRVIKVTTQWNSFLM